MPTKNAHFFVLIVLFWFNKQAACHPLSMHNYVFSIRVVLQLSIHVRENTAVKKTADCKIVFLFKITFHMLMQVLLLHMF